MKCQEVRSSLLIRISLDELIGWIAMNIEIRFYEGKKLKIKGELIGLSIGYNDDGMYITHIIKPIKRNKKI